VRGKSQRAIVVANRGSAIEAAIASGICSPARALPGLLAARSLARWRERCNLLRAEMTFPGSGKFDT